MDVHGVHKPDLLVIHGDVEGELVLPVVESSSRDNEPSQWYFVVVREDSEIGDRQLKHSQSRYHA